MKRLIFILVLFVCAYSYGQHGVCAIQKTLAVEGMCVGTLNFGADAGSSDDYAMTFTPAPDAYVTGAVYYFTANTANTGAATLNVNSLGAKTIKKLHDQDLATGDIEAGQVVVVVYDGTNMQIISQLAQ